MLCAKPSVSQQCLSSYLWYVGAVKGEAAELDGGLGFMEDSVGLLGALVSVPIVEDSPCVDTIAFSSFNPVPGYRR